MGGCIVIQRMCLLSCKRICRCPQSNIIMCGCNHYHMGEEWVPTSQRKGVSPISSRAPCSPPPLTPQFATASKSPHEVSRERHLSNAHHLKAVVTPGASAAMKRVLWPHGWGSPPSVPASQPSLLWLYRHTLNPAVHITVKDWQAAWAKQPSTNKAGSPASLRITSPDLIIDYLLSWVLFPESLIWGNRGDKRLALGSGN